MTIGRRIHQPRTRERAHDTTRSRHDRPVLIDLQNGVVGVPLAPRSGPDVIAVGKSPAERFRAAKANVVLVRIDFAEDFADAPSTPVDQPMTRPPGGMPKELSALVAGLAQPGDLHIVKRQMGRLPRRRARSATTPARDQDHRPRRRGDQFRRRIDRATGLGTRLRRRDRGGCLHEQVGGVACGGGRGDLPAHRAGRAERRSRIRRRIAVESRLARMSTT